MSVPRALRTPVRLAHSSRLYSTAPKPSLKDLVAALRKHAPDVAPTKAAEALLASGKDVSAALAWLETDRVTSAAKKAAKVAGRTAGEGLVGAAVLARGTPGPARAALVELACETDFVARNALFGGLLADVAHTAAFLAGAPGAQPVPLDALIAAPLIAAGSGAHAPTQAGTVGAAIEELVGKVGEKVELRRALTLLYDPARAPSAALRVAARTHQSVGDASQGRIAALALAALKSPRLPARVPDAEFQGALERLMGGLGRQIIGFPTKAVRPGEGVDAEEALYEQQFAMLGGEGSELSVRAYLDRWAREQGLVEEAEEDAGVEVLEFVKWTVGEPL